MPLNEDWAPSIAELSSNRRHPGNLLRLHHGAPATLPGGIALGVSAHGRMGLKLAAFERFGVLGNSIGDSFALCDTYLVHGSVLLRVKARFCCVIVTLITYFMGLCQLFSCDLSILDAHQPSHLSEP